jgi:hypothetical protein
MLACLIHRPQGIGEDQRIFDIPRRISSAQTSYQFFAGSHDYL